MAREVEALELTEHRRPQVVLDVERDATAAEPPEVREHEGQRAHREHQREPRCEWLARLVVRGGRDHVVDDDLLHDWQERPDELAAGRHTERDVRVLLVRLHVADEPADPTLSICHYGLRPSMSCRLLLNVRASGLRGCAFGFRRVGFAHGVADRWRRA